MRRRITRLLPLFFAVLGLLGLAHVVLSTAKVFRVRSHFVRVPGTLLECELERRESWRPMGRKTETWRLSAFYHYLYQGNEYEGRAVLPRSLPEVRAESFQRQLYQRLKDRNNVELLVNPEDPTESYLAARVDWWIAGSLGTMTLALAATGCWLLLLSWRGLVAPVPTTRLIRRLGIVIGLSLCVYGSRMLLVYGESWAWLGLGLMILTTTGLQYWIRARGRRLNAAIAGDPFKAA